MDILKIRKRAQAQREASPGTEPEVAGAPEGGTSASTAAEAPVEAAPVVEDVPREEAALEEESAFEDFAPEEPPFEDLEPEEPAFAAPVFEEPSAPVDDAETIVVPPPAKPRAAPPAAAKAPTKSPSAKSPSAKSPSAKSPSARAPAIEVRPPRAEPPVEYDEGDDELEEALEADFDDPLSDFLARYDAGAAPARHDTVEHEELREESKRYLAFHLEDEEYAVSIMDVREILRVVALTEVPRAPREVLGILSKRGVVMPVIDLGALLKLRAPDPRLNQNQRILVVGEGDRVCGLRIDRMQEVVRLRVGDIEEVPASLGARSVHLLRGLGRVGDRILILLDMDAVLHGLAVSAGLESREEVAS